MSRRLVVLLTAVLAGVVPFLVPPAQAATPSYVALGDSYSSGVGTRSYISDGTSCQRSVYAYPSLIASARGYALNFRACSGAKIADVTNTQLSALSASTSYVTISVGGNDAGFSSVLTTCAQPSWLSNCNGAVDKAQAYINGTLPSALATLYAAIRSRAPSAKVVVVGYPRIFNGTDCNLFTWFSGAEMTRLNQPTDLLDSRLQTAATNAGFSFSNPVSRFVGHAVCDNPEWLNGLSSPTSESFHPNRAGHSSGYTPLVSPVLTGAMVRVTQGVLSDARAAGSAQARLQSRYAAVDRSIRPESFLLPDLSSPRAQRVAERKGIDLARWVATH